MKTLSLISLVVMGLSGCGNHSSDSGDPSGSYFMDYTDDAIVIERRPEAEEWYGE